MPYSKGFQVGEIIERHHLDIMGDEVKPINYAFDLSKQPKSIVYYNDTALIVAARQGNLEEVQIIICMTALDKQFELINFKKKEGSTALNVAARGGYLDVVEYLISYGASVCEDDLKIAIESEQVEVVKYLLNLDFSFSSECLFMAAKQGSAAIVDAITQKMVSEDINSFNENGHTALHICAAAGCLEAVKILLERGALINLRVPFLEAEKPIAPGYRAVDFAATRGHSEVALYLMSKGANTDGFLFYKSSAARAEDNGHPRLAKAITLYNKEISFDIYPNKKVSSDAIANSINLPSDIVLGGYGLNMKKEEKDLFMEKLY